MIKQGVINFLKNLKYFFTALGALALGLILGLSVFIPGILKSFSTLADSIQRILSDTTIDFTALKDCAVSAVQALDWSNPFGAARTILGSDWLMQTLNDCAAAFVESVAAYATQFTAAIDTFTHDLSAYFAVVIVFAVLGVIGGFFLTRWLIHKNTAGCTLRTYLLSALVDSLLSAAFIALCVWLMSVWKPSIFIASFVCALLFGVISLTEAYLVYARNKTEIKQIINAKNIFKLFLTNIIIFVMSAVFIVLITLLTNIIVGIFIGIVLMEITFIAIGLNAETYVKTVVGNNATN